MTAHSPSRRYRNIDAVIDDLIWALVHIGIPTDAPSSDEEDKKLLIKLLSSRNAENQSKAIEPAMRLGTAALPVLHEQIGNRRLDVAVAAYRILGEIANESSIPYLQAGLYPRRTAKKPQFVTGKYAASALRSFSPEVRLNILASITDEVKATDIELLIDDLDSQSCYPRLLTLYQEKKFYQDWSERAGLSLLLRVDEEKSWPIVESLMSEDDDFYTFMAFRDIYPHVNQSRKRRIIDHFLERPRSLSSWELPRILNAVSIGKFPKDYVRKVINRIGEVTEVAFKHYDERKVFLKHIEAIKKQLNP